MFSSVQYDSLCSLNEKLYSPQMVELRNNKNNNNLKKNCMKKAQVTILSLDLTKCTAKFTVQ